MSKIDGQGFYEKLPRFFLNIKSNCDFSEKEKKKNTLQMIQSIANWMSPQSLPFVESFRAVRARMMALEIQAIRGLILMLVEKVSVCKEWVAVIFIDEKYRELKTV